MNSSLLLIILFWKTKAVKKDLYKLYIYIYTHTTWTLETIVNLQKNL